MTYRRMIPRDLFNEANLLKCYGQLYLLTEGLGPYVQLLHTNDDDRFDVVQNPADGSLSIGNIHLLVDGKVMPLMRPLNSREPWPLYAGDDDVVSVFTDEGDFTEEFEALLYPQEEEADGPDV